MHPLSVFPTLLNFGLIAPLLLRVAVGLVIVMYGRERYKKPDNWTSIPYFIVGVLLILGLYTQPVAIAGIILNKIESYPKWKAGTLSKQGLLVYFLTGIILLSLLFTGPGFLAFDLPL